MRDLAWVDVETTGLVPRVHELLEVAVVRTTPELEELERLEVKVRPEAIAVASPRALALNGYTPEAWADVLPLREALELVAPLLAGATLAGHNVAFDRSFLVAGFSGVGLALPKAMDYHQVDTVALAWPLLAAGRVSSLRLEAVAAALGVVPQGRPHRALTDALTALQVARRLLATFRVGLEAEASTGP